MPWIEGFPQDRCSYRSRLRAKRRKEQQESDRLMILERNHDQMVALYKEQQKQIDQMREQGAPTLQLEQASQGGPSHRRSSVASSVMVGDDETSYPVDYITEKTTCELHVPVFNLSTKVADGYAFSIDSTASWLGNAIPDGFARVGVDQVVQGYESLNLEFPRADDESVLGDVVGGLILWRKKYIKFEGWAPRPPSSPPIHDSPPDDDEGDDNHQSPPHQSSPPPRAPTPPPRAPTPPPREPTPLLRQPTPPLHEPTPPPHEPTPPPHEPTPEPRHRKGATSSSMGFGRDPRRSPLPKVPKSLDDLRACDMTKEQLDAWVDADTKRQLARKKPEEKQTFTAKENKWAIGFITEPSQYEKNKPDNYLRALSKSSSSPKTRSSSARGKRDVAQLGQQANQSIAPLVVIPSGHGSVTDLIPTLSLKKDFAAAAGITLAQLDNENLFPSDVDDSWKWKWGRSLLRGDQIKCLPTCMRQLHSWYMKTTKEFDDFLICVKVTKNHFAGEDMFTIQLEELWYLYNLDSLDLALVGAYCL